MFKDLYQPPADEIRSISWNGNPADYDSDLCSLVQDAGTGLVINPYIEDQKLIHYIEEIPQTDKCVVWLYQETWVAKLFTSNWTPDVGYEEIKLTKPKLVWNRNPDLDRLMTFEDNPFGQFEPEPWDRDYKLIWYIDPRFNPLPDKVWTVSCQPVGRPVKGTKDMGYMVPDVNVEFNEHLPNLSIDIDECCPPFWELTNECAYELDPVHQTGDRLWVVKFTPAYKKPRQWKWLGIVSPQINIEYNPVLPKMTYDIDYVIPWHDLGYEHVWMLDRKHLQNGEEDIWAIKKSASIAVSSGTKVVGSVTPKISVEYNRKLPRLNFNLNYEIPWHDLKYKHVWMLDRKHLQNGEEDIWAVKIKCSINSINEKSIGYIDPIIEVEYNNNLPKINYKLEYTIPWHDLQYIHSWYLDENTETKNKIWVAKMKGSPDAHGEKIIGNVTLVFNKPDVIFISYNEPNAEKNWERVLEKAPHAKRVNGVTGIFEAHKEAARLSTTDMFYVVDGDSYLTDEWEFNYQPGIFDRDCTYIWYSKNVINNLTYGYGGVKLFPKHAVTKSKTWTTLDLSTSITDKVKIIEKVSNYTNFNTDEFSTWRSVFRECVKLYVNNFYYPENYEHSYRLENWTKVNNNVPYATYIEDAATRAVKFARENIAYKDILLKINNREWLEEQFKQVEASNGRKE